MLQHMLKLVILPYTYNQRIKQQHFLNYKLHCKFTLAIDRLSNSTEETGPVPKEWFANPRDWMGQEQFTFSLDPAGTGREWNQSNGTGRERFTFSLDPARTGREWNQWNRTGRERFMFSMDPTGTGREWNQLKSNGTGREWFRLQVTL